ncbi:MAG: M1 family metallopeptidase [Candidatus Nitronauta litoralis]|uniref:M1 family metallopeptidase n=1 Tax=Candidatus Nitronauta litoralis TaxID=2705533 RepID=A0A7T0BT19_9BACT|nr:MAG: M1 family metallopeptidase [Candidatus Nitronauta litoralis]
MSTIRRGFTCLFLSLFFQGALLCPPPALAGGLKRPVEHKLSIELKPHLGTLTAEDALTLYPGKWNEPSFVFLLHGDFKVDPVEIPHQGDWKISATKTRDGSKPINRIEIFKPTNNNWPDFIQFKFRYRGPYRDLQETGEQNSVENAHTVFLSQNSLFYPVIETGNASPLIIFEMQTTTPPGWEVVSEGKRISHIDNGGRISTLWKCDDPMEEIHLITDRYHEFRGRWEDIDLQVFLRSKDPELAQRFIETAKLYIPFYQRLIGSYPFVKFAVVENSEQTGYGMPSFTLLGSQVIRFPFILHTSYPHEILHNWWGNGAFVKTEEGNWSEGLTTYLADHLMQDLKGKGDRYRFQELMKYKNYVSKKNDFPLNEFISRTDMTTQAIGYGKLVMVFHMLRKRIGEKVFLDALHDFYFEHIFKRAGYQNLQEAMEAHSRQDLSTFFRQWISSKGAPQITLGKVSSQKTKTGFQLDFEVLQNQNGSTFDLDLPYIIWSENNAAPLIKMATITQSNQNFSISLSSAPRAILLDPWNEVFRQLNEGEVPPSISQSFGDSQSLIVIEENGEQALQGAYKYIASTLNGKKDTEADWLEQGDHSVWLLGHHFQKNQPLLKWLETKGIIVKQDIIRIDGQPYSLKEHSVALTVPHPKSPRHSISWILLHSAEAAKGLARKLPHYGKYGYLVFKGDQPTNVAKGAWPANPKGRLHRFSNGPLPLPEQKPLVDFRPGDPLE